MPRATSIGIVEWVKNSEYGVLLDAIRKEEVFFHIRRNPGIGRVNESSVCVYSTDKDPKRRGSIAVGMTLIEEADERELYNIIHDNLEKLAPSRVTREVLPKLSQINAARILDKLIYELDTIDSPDHFTRAEVLMQLAKSMGPDTEQVYARKIMGLALPSYKAKLWIGGHTQALDRELLTEQFLTLTKHDRSRVMNRMERHVLLSVLLDILSKNENRTDTAQNELVILILEEPIKWSEEERTILVDGIQGSCGPYAKVQLWLKGYSTQFDYGLFRLQFLLLNAEDQFRFLRRLIYEYEQEKLSLTVEMIEGLIRFEDDPSTVSGLDCSVDIAIRMIVDLSQNIPLSEERNIGLVLTSHFARRPFGKFQIAELFEKCEGRGAIKAHYDYESNQIKIEYNRTKEIPSGVLYCEGRKAKVLDRTYQREFWWCRNLPCFMPCNTGNTARGWENYTMRDLLRVLSIPVNDDMYQMFLGFVNRVNNLLSHLNCKSCGYILSPSRQSNFGFYRASRFTCTNPDCNSNIEIYLNHCMNGRCGKIVDSRDSAQCPNSYHVCKSCYSCCSNAVFVRRIEHLKTVGQPVPEQLRYIFNNGLGHAERFMRFCYKCGTQLVGGTERYRKTLKWLKDHAMLDPRIPKSGQDRQGISWFLVNFPEEKYLNLKEMGFEVQPSDDGLSRMVYEREKRTVSFSLGKCPNEECSLWDSHVVK